jgi:hypothetical protein
MLVFIFLENKPASKVYFVLIRCSACSFFVEKVDGDKILPGAVLRRIVGNVPPCMVYRGDERFFAPISCLRSISYTEPVVEFIEIIQSLYAIRHNANDFSICSVKYLSNEYCLGNNI